MARTSQKNTSLIARPPTPHQHPGVWIQYKGPRARVLQTTKVSARSASLTANIEDEFRADLEALKLNVPGVPLEEIKVVWGTGQVRATYGIQGNVRLRPWGIRPFRTFIVGLIGISRNSQASSRADEEHTNGNVIRTLNVDFLTHLLVIQVTETTQSAHLVCRRVSGFYDCYAFSLCS